MRVTVRDVLVTALENLKKDGFKKFQAKLHDTDIKQLYRKIPRSQLEDKDQSDVADLIRTYYKDVYGVEVTLAVLDAINEKLVAEELRQDLKKDRFVRMGEIEEEKTAAPTGRPVIRSLCDSGELRYSLTLEGFYPGYLHFQWTCGENKDADILSSRDCYIENNHLFTVCSEVIIPQTVLRSPGSTVLVSWEHEYTNSTGHEKLCIRDDKDFPWRPAVEEVQVPHLFHDTPITLQCDISGYYPDDISVTWLRRNKETRELCEDSASIQKTSSNKNTDNTYSCTARLTITPALRVHQGAEYICRVQHPSLQGAIEKSTGRLSLMGKPQMDPIQMTLVDTIFIQFCLTLKKFYPKDIKIKWYREEPQPRKAVRQGTKHTETITEEEDLTFCVTSECQVWGPSFADPQYKLYVTWEHSSLDGPETRTLSVRDFPWHPILGKINVPLLEDNQKSMLKCHITGYFPNVITVAWFRSERGVLSAAPVSSNMAVEILPHKDVKTTFGCTAILYFTPTIREDQGSEFICRVEHPSLERPIEISTGPLEIFSLLEVTAPAAQTAILFQSFILPCTFHMDTLSANQQYLSIIWYFGGKELLKTDNKEKVITKGVSFDEKAAIKGNASLTIHNVTIANHRTYKCLVIHSPYQQFREIQLTVYARPLLSILSKSIQRNKENALTCMAIGFFPPDIRITWYRDGEVLKNQFMGKLNKYKDRTYQVKSSTIITLSDDDQNKTFTCTIQHVSLPEAIQEDFQVIYEETSSTEPIVVGVVLLALIATAIGIFFWNQTYRGAATFTLMEIDGPSKLVAGEETSLYCKATKCPENTSVTWLEKREGQVYEIPESHGGDKEEEERLMDTQYGVISCRDGPNYTSLLKFRPNVTNHKDVTFICRYSCGKWRQEKTFHCRAICAKLQMLQPISRTLTGSGELKYSITLEKFYPRDITLRWTHGVGEPHQALPSTETFTDIPDGTYSVCSEVTISEELLKDPEFRVQVSWEHESLDTLGYKDLSIRDSENPWSPAIEEIQTPNLFHDTPVTLQCHITKYFPNVVTVTWLRRSRDEELYEETDNMVTSIITPRREADNTYSCTASLTIVPTLSVHQGAEYICRVNHPSLERPIEGRTGKLVVK
ncbi:uncharacterized protein LOC143923717 isoform X2 [Lithobates pipiens]